MLTGVVGITTLPISLCVVQYFLGMHEAYTLYWITGPISDVILNEIVNSLERWGVLRQ